MKKISYILAIVASVALISCKNDCGKCKNTDTQKCTESSCQKDTTQN